MSRGYSYICRRVAADSGCTLASARKIATRLGHRARLCRHREIALLLAALAVLPPLWAQMQIVPSILSIARNGVNGFSWDGGQATGAELSANGVTVDPAGNL